MKKIFILSVFIFHFFVSHSQEKKTVYVDENYQIVSRKEFNKKNRSKLFYITNLDLDTAFYKKLRYKEFFGKLDFKKKHQLNKLFQSRFKIDTTKIWVIHYIDSLPNVKEMPKKSGIVFLDSIKVKHKHVVSYEDYRKGISKEKKQYNKFKDVELIHFYEFNKGYPKKDIESDHWYHDNIKMLKRIFTDGMKMYKVIILFPNGDFCLNPYGYDKVKKILKKKKYYKEKKKWEKKHKFL